MPEDLFPETAPAERAQWLRQQLHHHAHRYYTLDEPEIPDAEYAPKPIPWPAVPKTLINACAVNWTWGRPIRPSPMWLSSNLTGWR